MNFKRSVYILLTILAGTLSNIIFKARLVGVNTKGEKDMLVAKSEARSAENFGFFL